MGKYFFVDYLAVYILNILYILKRISPPERPVQSAPLSGSLRPVCVCVRVIGAVGRFISAFEHKW